MKIGVYFSDNDFWNEFYSVFKVLLLKHEREGKLTTDKKILVNIINNMTYGFYLLKVSDRKYPSDSCLAELRGSSREKRGKYLLISESDIFIDDEIDEYLKEDGEDQNSELHIMDTVLQGVYSI